MMFTIFIFIALFLNAKSTLSDYANGSVSLTSMAFDKVIRAHKFVFVKFDQSFAMGDNHDEFKKVAKASHTVDGLLIAEVQTTDYGDFENKDILERYSLDKEKLPVYLLFNQNPNKPIRYRSESITVNDLLPWLTIRTGFYILMPGCIEAMDKIGNGFRTSKPIEYPDLKNALLLEKNKITDQILSKTAEIYLKIADKIDEKGVDFVRNEIKRLKKLAKGKLSEKKKEDLTARINILTNFLSPKEPETEKTEL